jgi:hypothetical protein
MTSTSVSNKTNKSTKKKQQSPASVNIGSPLRPIRKQQNTSHHEVLSDWSHAS